MVEHRVPKSIGFRMGGITNKYTGIRASINFGGGRVLEGEGVATNFTKVG